MSIQGGNRNAKNLPMDDGERGWSNGLCSCFDECGTCCLAMWCPCILYSKVKHRYDHLERKGFPDPEHGGGVCTGFCMLYAAMAWIASPCVLQCLNRGDVRRRYNIKGNGCTDLPDSLLLSYLRAQSKKAGKPHPSSAAAVLFLTSLRQRNRTRRAKLRRRLKSCPYG
ncbi:PLAC8 family-domain-containing protein [Flagelloscypha sp. PMI_526]|nr:PLAC8 family-domain-containing protein [Flagelloscypha sp. PMI_526]